MEPERRELIKSAADAVGESVNAYINATIDMRMGAAATVPEFMRRAVAEQAHRDRLSRKLPDHSARSAAK